MIPYELDPSLHNADPEPEQFDDGFSPPHRPHDAPHAQGRADTPAEPVDPAVWGKSLF